MNKTSAARAATSSQAISQLLEISKLDTLYRDLYFQRARGLLRGLLPESTFTDLKERAASLPWLQQQLRASIERGEWERSQQLTAQISAIRESLAAKGQAMNQAEVVYESLADIPIDPFSTGFHVFAGGSGETLEDWKNQAVSILSGLQRNDTALKDFYARREADFKALRITAPVATTNQKEKGAEPAQLQQQALSALESGDLSQLDRLMKQLQEKVAEKPVVKESEGVQHGDAPELGDDLLYSFSEETLAGAAELGLAPVRTKSRRQFAYLLPHGWQPWFLKAESRHQSKAQLERLTYPSGTSDKNREAIEFFLLNPFINSGGTRYQVCLVVEDLLIEDFAEPETREESQFTKLLSALGLEKRWGLSRIDIETALLQQGPEILEQRLGLDPEAFRLVAIPPDIYTHLGNERGWGQKEMWTHFDGYRALEGGKLQALAGGDKRFGGAHDVVSFSPSYASEKIFARFAVVQRKRMMSWHQK
jgi:hypothetical protein